jgi:hypothetical protein
MLSGAIISSHPEQLAAQVLGRLESRVARSAFFSRLYVPAFFYFLFVFLWLW